jgi:hypothetical protein
MAAFTLVMMIGFQSAFSGNGYNSAQVSGFSTLEACQSAGKQWLKETGPGYWPTWNRWSCVETR